MAFKGWVCNESSVLEEGQKPTTMSNSLEKYELSGIHVEDTEPEKTTIPGSLLPAINLIPTEWDILQNNQIGLIAVQTEDDVLSSHTQVWTDVLLIDKVNLTMTEFEASAENKKQNITSGSCIGY